MKYRFFEDLPIFQKSMHVMKRVNTLVFNSKIKKQFYLRDQINKSALSIVSNIAEGFERQSNPEFVKFLYYSKGSLGELRAQLLICKELDYISNDMFLKERDNCIELSKEISNFIKYLKNSNY